jgi:DNA-3-methyladenine glycosylase II
MNNSFETQLKSAAEHLAKNDAALAPIIKQAGLCTIRPHKNYYQELVESIVGQQLSVKAAAAIRGRFLELFGGKFPTPAQILTKKVDDFRAIGFSRAKSAYVLDLAQHVVDGRVKFDHLDELSNDEIIKELTAVKGIGEWTAHMFLMFSLGRLDVLAHGDLGIRMGVKKLYGFEEVPTPQQVIELADKNNWAPYQSVACWYIWQSLEV